MSRPLRILLSCQQSLQNYALPAYRFWRTYFIAGLREAGHEVFEVPDTDWARALLPLSATELNQWRNEQWSRTLAFVRATPGLDLFLGYLYSRQIEPSALKELRTLGIRTVNFFCDNVREFRRLPVQFAPFDLHWVPEYDALPLYAARNWPALFAPMPCWVAPARRVAQETTSECIVFIGRRDPLRSALLAHAARANLPLKLYGAGWSNAAEPAAIASAAAQPNPSVRARLSDWKDFYRRQGPGPTWRRFSGSGTPTPDATFDFSSWSHAAPDDDGYAQITASSAITLGVNRCPPPAGGGGRPLVYSRLRDIEAPMLGACYLTEWAPELASLYEVGSEIEIYRDEHELVAQARALLADPARRHRLRLAALRRAHADHTIGATLTKIATRLGLPS